MDVPQALPLDSHFLAGAVISGAFLVGSSDAEGGNASSERMLQRSAGIQDGEKALG